MRRILLCLLLFAISQIITAQSPKYEMRAVWLTTIGGLDWPSTYAHDQNGINKQKEDLRRLLKQYKQAGINTVILQSRVRATTIYPSVHEPWDGCLSGKPGQGPGYDPLQFAVEECHRLGMQLHAWVVTIPIGKWNSYGCATLKKRNPQLVKKIGIEGYMNPEHPQTANYIATLCEEIVKNYDVDGIHLDYIRYPETWKITIPRQQARKNITHIVETVHERVRQIKPWVMISCSPIGKHDDLSRYRSNGWNAYTTVCQDAQAWLRDGLMDALFPMMYFKGNNFFPFAIDWAEQACGKIVAPGLGIYFLSPREQNWPLETISREMEVLRQYGLGHAYFRGRFLTDNVKGIYTYVSRQFDATPALVPPMTWRHDTPPTPPTTLQINLIDGDLSKTILQWDGAEDRSHGDRLSYNVYSSTRWPVDTDNPQNLIAQSVMGKRLVIDLEPNGRFYAVTATDRYGNESNARQMEHQKDKSITAPPPFLECDGRTVILPTNTQMAATDMLAIESLQGNLLKVTPRKRKDVSVSSLQEGIYILKTINKRGVTHRVGFFMVKRH